MTHPQRRLFARLGLVALIVASTASFAAPAPKVDASASNKVVFQVSDGDPAKWNLVLNNMRNLQADVGESDVALELVVFGPGIGMLKGDSPVATRVAETLKTGARVVACQNTMKGQKLVEADMLPGIGYVPSGVVEVMRKQQQGYAYLRP